GGPTECPVRPFCQLGLEKTYGLRFTDFRSLDAGGPLTKTAIKQGKGNVGLVFSSDGGLFGGWRARAGGHVRRCRACRGASCGLGELRAGWSSGRPARTANCPRPGTAEHQGRPKTRDAAEDQGRCRRPGTLPKTRGTP